MNTRFTRRGLSPSGESFPPSRMNPNPAMSLESSTEIVLYAEESAVECVAARSIQLEVESGFPRRPAWRSIVPDGLDELREHELELRLSSDTILLRL